MKKQELLDLVEKSLNRAGIKVGSIIVVAVSGGPDSMALLDIIRQINKKVELVVVHVNHGLRKSADKDQNIVENYCLKYELELVVKRVKLSGSKTGIEERARKARYKVLREVADTQGAKFMILAHHGDDQIETVIFNFVRGSGLRGWGGMKEVAGDLIRPFLSVRKEDLLKYCKRYKVPFVVDPTNKSLDFSRNFIRNKLLKELKYLNPKADEQILKTSGLMQQGEWAVRELARTYLIDIGKVNLSSFTLSLSKFKELGEFMQAEVLRYGIEAIGEDLVDWTGARFEQIRKMVTDNSAISKKEFSRLVVEKSYDKITITKA